MKRIAVGLAAFAVVGAFMSLVAITNSPLWLAPLALPLALAVAFMVGDTLLDMWDLWRR